MRPTANGGRLRRRKAIPWIFVGLLLVMAIGLFLAVRWGILSEQARAPDAPPAPGASSENLPPPEILVPPPKIPQALTRRFPQIHEGFQLVSIETEQAEGVLSGQLLAHYKHPEDGEIFVRWVEIRKNPEAFANQALRMLVGAGSVKSAGPLTPAKESLWMAAHLFSRGGAGIYLVYNQRALMTVSAGSPEAARAFGETLKIQQP